VQRQLRLAAASQETGKALLHLGGARCGETKLAKQTPAGVTLEMLEMLEGRWKDRKAQERQPGSLRRPQRGGVCGAEFVAVFGAQDRGWFWLPCARMLQDSNEGLATCKNVEQCAPHTHLDKGDFMLKPVMKFPFVWHSLFVHFYRVHSGQMAVCFQDHDAKYLQLIRRTAKPTRRHRRSPALHNALAGNKKW
jgi:hypothetical protein